MTKSVILGIILVFVAVVAMIPTTTTIQNIPCKQSGPVRLCARDVVVRDSPFMDTELVSYNLVVELPPHLREDPAFVDPPDPGITLRFLRKDLPAPSTVSVTITSAELFRGTAFTRTTLPPDMTMYFPLEKETP